MVMERLDERIGERSALNAKLPCLSSSVLAQLLMVMERRNKRMSERLALQPGRFCQHKCCKTRHTCVEVRALVCDGQRCNLPLSLNYVPGA